MVTARTPRKRPARKKPARRKRSNSNIAAAQRAAAQGRTPKDKAGPAPKAPLPAGGPKPAKLEPRTSTPMAGAGKGIDQELIRQRDNKAGESMLDAARTVAGLTSGIMEKHQVERRALADPALFGNVSDKSIKARLVAQANAITETKNKKLKDSGGAIYLGTKKQQIRRAQRGGEFEGGTNRTPQAIDVDDVRSKDELMSWLADEKLFNEIKAKAQKAGIQVESYDDVAKLWSSIVSQAAATYSSVGKKVTPWDLLALRGKTMVGGKPASKTTTSTTIDEMDPAEAKLMIRSAAANALGRDPTTAEIEDLIAKAQTIAKANPNVTTTTTQYDFAGDPTGQSSISKGGGDAVSAQAQEAAIEQAKQSEDYAAYQAAGVMMPWLNEALASPF